MKTSLQDLAEVSLQENYRVKEYYEHRGIKGVLSWWTNIKTEKFFKDKTLHITCDDTYDEIIINGKKIKV